MSVKVQGENRAKLRLWLIFLYGIFTAITQAKKSMSKVLIKLFVGCSLNSELRLLLSQSSAWKQVKILNSSDPNGFRETRYKDKEYFGRYLQKESIVLSELRQIESEIKESLAHFCPKYSLLASIKINVFSQVFVE